MQATSSGAIIIKIASSDSVEDIQTTARNDSTVNIKTTTNFNSKVSDSFISDSPYSSQVTINSAENNTDQQSLEVTTHYLTTVKLITKITDETVSAIFRNLASKLTITEFVRKSRNYARVNDWNFPDYCDNKDDCVNDELNKLIDPSDNFIQVGSSLIFVNYGKYYDKIFQFDEKFIALIGTNFRASGLTESLFFNTETYTLSGDIPFTEPKTITFIINETYKYTLILKVDVHECFVE